MLLAFQVLYRWVWQPALVTGIPQRALMKIQICFLNLKKKCFLYFYFYHCKIVSNFCMFNTLISLTALFYLCMIVSFWFANIFLKILDQPQFLSYYIIIIIFIIMINFLVAAKANISTITFWVSIFWILWLLIIW